MNKVAEIKYLNEITPSDDLSKWLEKTPHERIEAVETLRKQLHGNTARLQRVARIIERA